MKMVSHLILGSPLPFSFSVNVVANSDSLPLNKLDFSECRGCTPSYRELPPRCPPLHCSARGKLEQSVLNDTWVSVPVGSEGTEQSKQMRRSPTEERLLEFEEERFEVLAITTTPKCHLLHCNLLLY